MKIPMMLGALILLAVAPARGQRVRQATHAYRTEHSVLPEEARVLYRMTEDSLVTTHVIDPDEVVSAIVAFDGPPLVAAAAAGATSKRAAVTAAMAVQARERAQLQDVLNDLARNGVASKTAAPRITTRRDYHSAFNGVSLRAPQWVLDEVAGLPFVRDVTPNVVVRADDVISRARIRADRVQQELGATGMGVRIAVIDSGIDYTHPDLGGGLGPGFTVIGGYDFVDDDADPMDVAGHGTHVAGIIAGRGAAAGIAPGASLLAVRVLDAYGFGTTETLLAGIDYAVDPDGDATTDDGADVINMSLGGPGNADDPLARATDAAAAAGVVCVVSAGNEGDGYSTIGSPGAARLAVTVGASNNVDHMAPFSSRGPTPSALLNKPDVVAPGVGISSTVPGGYEAHDGTSMAAPHVAGTVALIQELHPTWSPAVVKAVVMQTAVDLGEDVWTQGAGRIDALAAAQATVAVTPGSISLGNLSLDQPIDTIDETLTVHNLSASSQSFTFALERQPTGTAVTFDPPSIDVAPGASRTVDVTFTIDAGTVPFAPPAPPLNVGRLVVHAATGDVAVPFTFVKSPRLVVEYDTQPNFVVIHKNGEEAGFLTRFSSGTEVLLEGGAYDVFAFYARYRPGLYDEQRMVVHEDVEVSAETIVNLSRNDAPLQFTTDLKDVDGQPLRHDDDLVWLISNDGWVFQTQTRPTTALYTSALSPRYRANFVFYNLSHASGADYVIPFNVTGGLASDRVLVNDPALLRRVDTRYVAPENVSTLYFIPLATVDTGFLTVEWGGFVNNQLQNYRIDAPYERTVYFGPRPEETDFFLRYYSELVFDHDIAGGLLDDPMYLLAPLEAGARETGIFRRFDFRQPMVSAPADGVLKRTVGGSPFHWAGSIVPSAPYAMLVPIFGGGLFYDPWGDVRAGNVAFDVTRDGSSVFSLALPNTGYFATFEGPQGPAGASAVYGGVRLVDHPVTATAHLSFDLSDAAGDDGMPPFLTELRVDQGGGPVDRLDPGQAAAITFAARDLTTEAHGQIVEEVPNDVALYFRRLGVTAWTELPADRIQDRYIAPWPASKPRGYYALRVEARDADDNALRYTADPAFVVGDKALADNTPPAAVALISPLDDAVVDATTVTFAWNPSTDDDAGDVVSYGITLYSTDADTAFTVTSGNSLTVDLETFLAPNTSYAWTVQATDGYAATPATATWHFTTSALPTAVAPETDLPASFAFDPSYPNPFRSSTEMTFSLPVAERVRIRVFDTLGRHVATLLDAPMPAGRHRVAWRPARLPAGMYLCRMDAGDYHAVNAMFLVR